MSEMNDMNELDWMKYAACRDEDPETFFPNEKNTAGIDDAKKICETCPVQADCLNFALADPLNSEYGVWGNKDQRERKEIVTRAKLKKARRSSGQSTAPASRPTHATEAAVPIKETAAVLGILALEV